MKTKSTLWRALSLAIFFTPAIAGAIQIKDKPQPRDCITHLTFDRTAIDFGHVDRMQASDRIAYHFVADCKETRLISPMR